MKQENNPKTLYLTKKEKNDLIKNNSVLIERKEYIPAPKSSILFGIGSNRLFDKVGYRWVYGDTERYIEENKGEGARGKDYKYGKDGDRNIWNGNRWYEFNSSCNNYGTLGRVMTNGRKSKVKFNITSFEVLELRPNGKLYLDIIYKMRVVLLS